MESEQTRNEFISLDGRERYHIGIIDYLQDYSRLKRIEYHAKTALKSGS